MYGILVVVAWVVATFAPAVMAVAFWRLGERLRPGWPVHLLFVTTVFLIEWASLRLFAVAAESGELRSPGLGLTLIPAPLLLILSVVAYFGTLGIAEVKRSRRRA